MMYGKQKKSTVWNIEENNDLLESKMRKMCTMCEYIRTLQVCELAEVVLHWHVCSGSSNQLDTMILVSVSQNSLQKLWTRERETPLTNLEQSSMRKFLKDFDFKFNENTKVNA